MDSQYEQMHQLPDGRVIPRRATTNPQERRSYENFTPAVFLIGADGCHLS